MTFKKKRNYFDANLPIPIPRSRFPLGKGGEAGANERMDALLKFLTFRRIAENLICHATPLRFRDKFMHNVVGIEGLNTEFIQIVRQQRFSAGDTAGECYSHILFSVN